MIMVVVIVNNDNNTMAQYSATTLRSLSTKGNWKTINVCSLMICVLFVDNIF